jgi:hypothetical protein
LWSSVVSELSFMVVCVCVSGGPDGLQS